MPIPPGSPESKLANMSPPQRNDGSQITTERLGTFAVTVLKLDQGHSSETNPDLVPGLERLAAEQVSAKVAAVMRRLREITQGDFTQTSCVGALLAQFNLLKQHGIDATDSESLAEYLAHFDKNDSAQVDQILNTVLEVQRARELLAMLERLLTEQTQLAVVSKDADFQFLLTFARRLAFIFGRKPIEGFAPTPGKFLRTEALAILNRDKDWDWKSRAFQQTLGRNRERLEQIPRDVSEEVKANATTAVKVTDAELVGTYFVDAIRNNQFAEAANLIANSLNNEQLGNSFIADIKPWVSDEQMLKFLGWLEEQRRNDVYGKPVCEGIYNIVRLIYGEQQDVLRKMLIEVGAPAFAMQKLLFNSYIVRAEDASAAKEAELQKEPNKKLKCHEWELAAALNNQDLPKLKALFATFGRESVYWFHFPELLPRLLEFAIKLNDEKFARLCVDKFTTDTCAHNNETILEDYSQVPIDGAVGVLARYKPAWSEDIEMQLLGLLAKGKLSVLDLSAREGLVQTETEAARVLLEWFIDFYKENQDGKPAHNHVRRIFSESTSPLLDRVFSFDEIRQIAYQLESVVAGRLRTLHHCLQELNELRQRMLRAKQLFAGDVVSADAFPRATQVMFARFAGLESLLKRTSGIRSEVLSDLERTGYASKDLRQAMAALNNTVLDAGRIPNFINPAAFPKIRRYGITMSGENGHSSMELSEDLREAAKTLEVDFPLDPDMVRNRHKELCKQYHPDAVGSQDTEKYEKFLDVQRAYELLTKAMEKGAGAVFASKGDYWWNTMPTGESLAQHMYDYLMGAGKSTINYILGKMVLIRYGAARTPVRPDNPDAVVLHPVYARVQQKREVRTALAPSQVDKVGLALARNILSQYELQADILEYIFGLDTLTLTKDKKQKLLYYLREQSTMTEFLHVLISRPETVAEWVEKQFARIDRTAY